MESSLTLCHRIYAETRNAAAEFQGFMTPLFAQEDLKPLEGCVLAELGYRDGQSINELAHATSILPTNLPPLWHALEKKGLVERRRDEMDSRSLRLYLTAEGTALLARVDQRISVGLAAEASERRALVAQAMAGFDALHKLLKGEEPEKEGVV